MPYVTPAGVLAITGISSNVSTTGSVSFVLSYTAYLYTTSTSSVAAVRTGTLEYGSAGGNQTVSIEYTQGAVPYSFAWTVNASVSLTGNGVGVTTTVYRTTSTNGYPGKWVDNAMVDYSTSSSVSDYFYYCVKLEAPTITGVTVSGNRLFVTWEPGHAVSSNSSWGNAKAYLLDVHYSSAHHYYSVTHEYYYNDEGGDVEEYNSFELYDLPCGSGVQIRIKGIAFGSGGTITGTSYSSGSSLFSMNTVTYTSGTCDSDWTAYKSISPSLGTPVLSYSSGKLSWTSVNNAYRYTLYLNSSPLISFDYNDTLSYGISSRTSGSFYVVAESIDGVFSSASNTFTIGQVTLSAPTVTHDDDHDEYIKVSGYGSNGYTVTASNAQTGESFTITNSTSSFTIYGYITDYATSGKFAGVWKVSIYSNAYLNVGASSQTYYSQSASSSVTYIINPTAPSLTLSGQTFAWTTSESYVTYRIYDSSNTLITTTTSLTYANTAYGTFFVRAYLADNCYADSDPVVLTSHTLGVPTISVSDTAITISGIAYGVKIDGSRAEGNGSIDDSRVGDTIVDGSVSYSISSLIPGVWTFSAYQLSYFVSTSTTYDFYANPASVSVSKTILPTKPTLTLNGMAFTWTSSTSGNYRVYKSDGTLVTETTSNSYANTSYGTFYVRAYVSDDCYVDSNNVVLTNHSQSAPTLVISGSSLQIGGITSGGLTLNGSSAADAISQTYTSADLNGVTSFTYSLSNLTSGDWAFTARVNSYSVANTTTYDFYQASSFSSSASYVKYPDATTLSLVEGTPGLSWEELTDSKLVSIRILRSVNGGAYSRYDTLSTSETSYYNTDYQGSNYTAEMGAVAFKVRAYISDTCYTDSNAVNLNVVSQSAPTLVMDSGVVSISGVGSGGAKITAHNSSTSFSKTSEITEDGTYDLTSYGTGSWFVKVNNMAYSTGDTSLYVYYPSSDPVSSFAYTIGPLTIDYVEYTFETDDNTAYASGYTGTGGSLILPSTITDSRGRTFTVIGVGSNAFEGIAFSRVTIPHTLQYINSYAFRNCATLTAVYCERYDYDFALVSIGAEAFSGCSALEFLVLPKTLSAIGQNAFNGCTALTNVYSLQTYANYSEITIGSGNSAIQSASWAYYSLTAPTTVVVSYWHYVTDEPTIWTISYETHTDDNGIIYSLINAETEYWVASSYNADIIAENASITSSIDGTPVTQIGDYAFIGCSKIKTITIPSSITSIGVSAFFECVNLTSVSIPNTCTSIGRGCFYGCTSLATLNPGTGIGSIPNNSFYGCVSLVALTLYSNIKSVGDKSFFGCTALEALAMIGATSIGVSSFEGCTALSSLDLGDYMTSIGNRAFYGCEKLLSFTLPSTMGIIGDYAFYGCLALTKATMNGMTSIGDYAFYGSGLKGVELPSSTESVGEYAFANNSALLYAVFYGQPEIGDNCFDGDDALAYAFLSSTTDWITAIASSIDATGAKVYAGNWEKDGNQFTSTTEFDTMDVTPYEIHVLTDDEEEELGLDTGYVYYQFLLLGNPQDVSSQSNLFEKIDYEADVQIVDSSAGSFKVGHTDDDGNFEAYAIAIDTSVGDLEGELVQPKAISAKFVTSTLPNAHVIYDKTLIQCDIWNDTRYESEMYVGMLTNKQLHDYSVNYGYSPGMVIGFDFSEINFEQSSFTKPEVPTVYHMKRFTRHQQYYTLVFKSDGESDSVLSGCNLTYVLRNIARSKR